jgi:anti-sigma B factor antagonist
MEIENIRNGDELVCKIKGRLDTNTAPAIMDNLDLNGVSDLVFDLKGVDYVFSAGLRIFLQAQKTMNAKGGKMRIINIDPAIKSIFEMVGFANIMDIE